MSIQDSNGDEVVTTQGIWSLLLKIALAMSVPMAADGELAHDQEQLTRCNLWQAAAAIPEAAAALTAVMTALPLIEAWAATQSE